MEKYFYTEKNPTNMEKENGSGDIVTATVELNGKYEHIADILAEDREEHDEMSDITADMASVLEIVSQLGGATKSRIAEELPPGVTADLDSDGVIRVLRVLELYGLVTLDGNTWRRSSEPSIE